MALTRCGNGIGGGCAALALGLFVVLGSPMMASPEFCPDSYEADNAFWMANDIRIGDEQDVEEQRHNFHTQGDEDWIEFCGLSDEVYTIEAVILGSSSQPQIDLFGPDGRTPLGTECWPDPAGIVRLTWKCPKGEDGIYFVRVKQALPDVFGEQTDYDLRIWIPRGTLSGRMCGIIRDCVSGRPVPSVSISTDGKAAARCTPRGEYLLTDTAGTYSMTAEAGGYKTLIRQITLHEGETTPVDFTLLPLDAPELAISSVSGPPEGQRAKTLDVAYKVINKGGSSAVDFKIGIYLSRNRRLERDSDLFLSETPDIQVLLKGKSLLRKQTVTIPSDTEPGDYYVCATADFTKKVCEANEKNNWRCSWNKIEIK